MVVLWWDIVIIPRHGSVWVNYKAPLSSDIWTWIERGEIGYSSTTQLIMMMMIVCPKHDEKWGRGISQTIRTHPLPFVSITNRWQWHLENIHLPTHFAAVQVKNWQRNFPVPGDCSCLDISSSPLSPPSTTHKLYQWYVTSLKWVAAAFVGDHQPEVLLKEKPLQGDEKLKETQWEVAGEASERGWWLLLHRSIEINSTRRKCTRGRGYSL